MAMTVTAEAKKRLREIVKNKLQRLDAEEVRRQSDRVVEQVVKEEWWRSSRRVSIFISMNGEIDTKGLFEHAFRAGKSVFIPYFERRTQPMRMLALQSLDEYNSLPTALYGIRQHATASSAEDFSASGPLDLVIMPGAAFQQISANRVHRLGHGAGFYDRWLAAHKETFGWLPTLVGVALREQMIDGTDPEEGEVPVTDTDVPLDRVVVATAAV